MIPTDEMIYDDSYNWCPDCGEPRGVCTCDHCETCGLPRTICVCSIPAGPAILIRSEPMCTRCGKHPRYTRNGHTFDIITIEINGSEVERQAIVDRFCGIAKDLAEDFQQKWGETGWGWTLESTRKPKQGR
jgi:hypothetical protein